MALSEEFKLDFKFGGNTEFLARLESLMKRVDEKFDTVESSITSTANATEEMTDAVDDLNASFKEGVSSLSSFGEKLQDITKYYLSFQAIRAGAERVWSFGRESMDAYSTQERAENQLKGVLKNRGSLDQFQSIKDYAAEIQGRSIYGDEALIKGAGELATYVKGTESLKAMMDLLTDYAAGMTGGGEVSPDQMESLATGLGMAYDGNYMAMRRKGFDTSKLEALDALQESGGIWTTAMEKKYGDSWSDKDKKDFREIVKQAKELKGVSEQMRVDALKEALGDWEGLSNAVNDLDSSALVRLNNKLGDLRENLGKKIYPTFNKLVDTVDKHMPDIEKAFDAIGQVFETIAKTIDNNFEKITGVVKVLTKLVSTVAEFPKASLGMVLALKAVSSGAFSASGQFGNLSKQINIATKEALNFNSVGAMLAGATIGFVGNDTAALEEGKMSGVGGVLGNVGMAALAGVQAFGLWGAAAAAAAAAIGSAFKSIIDEYDAYKDRLAVENQNEERRAMSDNLIDLQRRLENTRKKKIQVRGKNGAWEEVYDDAQEKKDLAALKDYSAAYEKRWGKGSIPKGVQMSIDKGLRFDRLAAERAAKNASRKAAQDAKGNVTMFSQYNNTNIEQKVSVASDIQKIGVLLNQNIRSIIEKQLRQNREVGLSNNV